MARNQSDSERSIIRPSAPDPQDYDLSDSDQMAEFQRANQAYIEHIVRDQVEAAMGPHSKNMRDVRLGEEYKAVARQHGNDKDFDKTMAQALDRVAESGGDIGIIEAYQQASGSSASRRRNEHLPEKLRDKKKGVGMLGKIMRHHEEKGAARPFGKGY
jgi:hypothetical protein